MYLYQAKRFVLIVQMAKIDHLALYLSYDCYIIILFFIFIIDTPINDLYGHL